METYDLTLSVGDPLPGDIDRRGAGAGGGDETRRGTAGGPG